MTKPSSQFVESNDRYLQIGEKPNFLILCKTHGDEPEVGDCVDDYIKEHISDLPTFLYIPEVSPTAVKLGTRKNANGLDLNRNFFSNSPDHEMQFIVNLLKKYQFNTVITFHEDPELDVFYMYDAYGENLEGTETLQKMREEIKGLGVGLLNGIDDPNDPTLGDTFIDGYKFYGKDDVDPTSGFLASWAYSEGIIKRFLNPEIPGKLDIKTKRKIVDIIFKYFITLG